MTTPLILSDVESAIVSALSFHRFHPFFIVREFGAVADLRERIRSGRSLRAPAVANPKENAKYRYDEVNLLMDRVQMEISVRQVRPRYRKSIDLVVLRSSPTVSVGNNGAGDVLEQFDLSDIDVAIEVKASQSADPASRGSYVQDIYALLRLREQSLKIHPDDPAHAYFVLFDRNDEVYGQWNNSKPKVKWESATRQRFVFARANFPRLTVDGSLAECGLVVSQARPRHTEVWIKCFVLDSVQPTPFCFYAFFRDGGTPTNLKPYVVSDGSVESDPSSNAVTDNADESVRRARKPGRRTSSSRKEAASKLPAKYRDALGNTWSGRGPRPKWLKAAVASGSSLESFLVEA